MFCVKQISQDISWIGGNDRRLALFENVYPVPKGVSYNSYFVSDEKTMIIDTVDNSVSGIFFENIKHMLAGRKLDYLVINHMEPDHAATVGDLVLRYPEVRIICNQKTSAMLKQYFDFDVDAKTIIVKEGDTVTTGKHTFTFIMAPMVHWPEVMMTFETQNGILFSADAFGTFGSLDGHMFADEVDFNGEYMDEARRYYTNIVGKYGVQVQAVLKKASSVKINMICPLHGFVWRKNINTFIDKYHKWSTYTPEETGVVIAYASVYGNTENTAEILACKLAESGKKVKMFDVSVTHDSYILSEIFRYSHVVFASTTYNAGIFVNMENLLHDIAAHNIQNRTVAFIENGTWAPTAGGLMKNIMSACKNMNFIEPVLTIKSSLKKEQLSLIDDVANEIISSMPNSDIVHESDTVIEQNALFKLSYGLFVLTAKDADKDNGCIINTVMQVTDTPKRITIAVNKANYTHDMILKTGAFNISVLSVSTPFDLFQRFGFQSGSEADKFKDDNPKRSMNGIAYIDKTANAFISAKVIMTEDCATHTLFTAEITEAKVLSNEKSATYEYYFENIKPQPHPAAEKKKGFVCKICGYVYEGDKLPEDFVCPLCKHGAEDFEPIE